MKTGKHFSSMVGNKDILEASEKAFSWDKMLDRFELVETTSFNRDSGHQNTTRPILSPQMDNWYIFAWVEVSKRHLIDTHRSPTPNPRQKPTPRRLPHLGPLSASPAPPAP